jgi:hypothetical protein
VEQHDLGLHKQDHFPLVSNLHVHVPQMTKRRRKKVVSRLAKMGPAEKALLVSELAGGEAAVHGDIANTVAGAAGLDEAAEAVLNRSGGGEHTIRTLATWRLAGMVQ